ncbi:MAG: hypothetical protein N7Q72_06875, partial [Spiroplasma sp. Tabriz.8]|nr:hypothetical protein [Candidatus Regiella insecticola]MCZ8632969.1 hypothetical protein [Spiroplasma sp. Tabriz.8]
MVREVQKWVTQEAPRSNNYCNYYYYYYYYFEGRLVSYDRNLHAGNGEPGESHRVNIIHLMLSLFC